MADDPESNRKRISPIFCLTTVYFFGTIEKIKFRKCNEGDKPCGNAFRELLDGEKQRMRRGKLTPKQSG